MARESDIPAMGHRFDRDLFCRNASALTSAHIDRPRLYCGTSWSWHQDHAQICRWPIKMTARQEEKLDDAG